MKKIDFLNILKLTQTCHKQSQDVNFGYLSVVYLIDTVNELYKIKKDLTILTSKNKEYMPLLIEVEDALITGENAIADSASNAIKNILSSEGQLSFEILLLRNLNNKRINNKTTKNFLELMVLISKKEGSKNKHLATELKYFLYQGKYFNNSKLKDELKFINQLLSSKDDGLEL